MHKRNILQGGLPIEKASYVMIMIHGRGGDARGIMDMAQYLGLEGFALLAPQATSSTWYPYSFLEPEKHNEPWLGSAVQTIHSLIDEVVEKGIPINHIYILGFSQGACLTLESAARKARPFGGIIAFTGGLIGDAIHKEKYSGDFQGTPVFIGTGDPDPHVPVQRVKDSTIVLQEMGARVTEKIYPGIGHTIIREEIDFVNSHILPAKIM
jgi:phospholipase/carboxylesterase